MIVVSAVSTILSAHFPNDWKRFEGCKYQAK
jgi:hypothetical protein